MKGKDYWGLFAEPGLGKTKIVLDILTYNKTVAKKGGTALIVCPNTLVENWAEEVVKHSDLSFIMLTGTRANRVRKLELDADVYIINYEATRRLTRELMERKFRFLVLDESTSVKNFKSQQSKACYDISTTTPRRFILSGTPIMNSPLDLFAQYKILSPLIFGTSFYRFRNRYAVMGGYMNKQAIQWKNLDGLKQLAYTCATRKTKKECLDLPDKLYQVIKVDLPDEQKEVYKKLKEDFIYEYRELTVTAPIMLTRLMRFSQITAGFTKDVEGIEHGFKKNPKIDWLINFLNELHSDRKVVIFCRFRHEIKMVEEALRKARVKHVSVHGGTGDRLDCINKFNKDKDIRCFVGQLQTAGIGINLTSASYCVFLSNSYSYGDRVQAEDRTHRIGQENNVTYIDVLARGTIDERMHKVLRKKESLANLVVDDLINLV
jgi:SNF2 family DNA or RNA helicase